MRTTLTLDDHLDPRIRILASKQRVTYRDMINHTIP